MNNTSGIGDLIKDIFISILILAAIVSVLGIIYYDDIPSSKVIPEEENYTLSAQMKKELENTNLEEFKEVVIDYHIDGSDLEKYEKANEYVEGKSNPFAPAQKNVENGNTQDENNVNNNTQSTNTNSNNGTENFYNDFGTK